MPEHVCLDPHDPYAQREVRVAFERVGSGFRLIAAIDDGDDDILPDLVDAQRADLLREIADADRVPPPFAATWSPAPCRGSAASTTGRTPPPPRPTGARAGCRPISARPSSCSSPPTC